MARRCLGFAGCYAMASIGCGPRDNACPRIDRTPGCGEAITLSVDDAFGLPDDVIDAVLEEAAVPLRDVVGMYVDDGGAFYDGSFTLHDEVTGEVWATRAAYATIAVRDADAALRVGDFGLQQGVPLTQPEDTLLLEVGHVRDLPGLQVTGRECGAVPFRLQDRPPALRLTETSCDDRDSDQPEPALVTFDLVRRSADSLRFQDIVRANTLAPNHAHVLEEFERCGAGWTRDVEDTYAYSGERGYVYVDYRATWYVADRCPSTYGIATLVIDLVEECWCPEDYHCDGRFDEQCVGYH